MSASRRCSSSRMPYSIWYSKSVAARPASRASAGTASMIAGSCEATIGYPEPAISTRRQRRYAVRDVGGVAVGHRRRFVVGALAQPDPRPGRGEFLAIAERAPQVGLQSHAQPAEVGAAGRARSSSVESVVVWSSASTVTHTPARCAAAQIVAGVLPGDLLAVASQRLPQGRQLQRHLERPDGGLIAEPATAASIRSRYTRTVASASSASVTSSPR